MKVYEHPTAIKSRTQDDIRRLNKLRYFNVHAFGRGIMGINELLGFLKALREDDERFEPLREMLEKDEGATFEDFEIEAKNQYQIMKKILEYYPELSDNKG